MCELFAICAEKPVDLTFSLERLARRGGLEADNSDGWGLTAYAGCDVYQAREPQPASNSRLMHCMETALSPTRLLISHLRQATRGERALCNTQPFVRTLGGRKHVFAHNGDLQAIESLPAFDPGPWGPVGDTDSELAFGALLARLEQLWRRNSDPDLEQRLEVVDEFAHDLRPLGPANFLYCDGEYLFTHGHKRILPDLTTEVTGLHMLISDDAGCGAFEGEGVTATCPGGHALLFASVPLTDGAWIPLQHGELVVSREGRIVRRLLTGETDPAPASGREQSRPDFG
jgi:glutamine amidotransferase